MSVIAYKKNVRDYADNVYSYTGASFEIDAEFTRLVPADLRIEERVTDATTVHQYYVANPFAWSVYETPFYDGSKVFGISEYVTKGISHNVTGIVNYLHDWLMNEVQANHSNVTLRSCEDTNLASKQQCMIKNANGTAAGALCIIPSIEVTLSSNTYIPGQVHDHQFSCRFALMLRAGTWDSATNVWNAPFQQLVYIYDFSGSNTSVLDEHLIDFINGILKMSYSIGPAPELIQEGNVWRINRTLPLYDRHFIWVKNDLLFTYGYFVIDSDFANLGGSWNSSGDIDPTDPWEQPEPYPPTPPKPPTPDPPVPVDPVDPVPEPDDPPIGGADIGFMSIYNPDRSTLKRIAAKFWDPNALQAIKQYFTDPIDSIIGLSIVPVTPVTRAAEAVVIGLYNTHVGAPVVTTEYATHNCGSVYIPKFFNSYLDYDPYTKYQLYLPYIGEVELNADEITSKTITIKYKCNVVTGDCVALVMIGNNVFGTFNGNFSRQVPITAANYGAIISAAVNVATTAATVGVGVIGSQLTGEAIAENAVKGSTKELTSSGAIRATGAEVAAMNTAATGAASLVNNVMSAKASYKKSGNVGQGAGQISVRTPFITVTRPNLTLPENIDQASQSSLKRYVGYPTNKVGPLSSFHGLTVVESCLLSSQHATDGEIAEALEIMKGGVIL